MAKERIFGVFPDDPSGIQLPQEFGTYEEALEYQRWLKAVHGLDSTIEEAL